MPELTVEQLIGEIRRRVDQTGGWDNPRSWAGKIGLTRAQVDQWMTRRAIPKPWKLALKGLKAP